MDPVSKEHRIRLYPGHRILLSQQRCAYLRLPEEFLLTPNSFWYKSTCPASSASEALSTIRTSAPKTSSYHDNQAQLCHALQQPVIIIDSVIVQSRIQLPVAKGSSNIAQPLMTIERLLEVWWLYFNYA